MPGTRTAPTIDVSPTFKEISIRWIDAAGDRRSDASMIAAAATEAEVEALIAAMVAASNASLYAVRLTSVYEGPMSKGNALSAVRTSAQDNIVFHAKDAGRVDRRAFVPAPLDAVFVSGTETPDEADVALIGVMDNWMVVWAGTFGAISLRFTERREINEKVNL